jgi:hypothetical protein
VISVPAEQCSRSKRRVRTEGRRRVDLVAEARQENLAVLAKLNFLPVSS